MEETYSEESSSLSKYQFLTVNVFKFSYKDSAKNIIKVIKAENTNKVHSWHDSFEACSASQV